MTNFLWKLRVLLDYLHVAFVHWHDDVWPKDPEELWCCADRDCGCEGQTMREMFTPESRQERT